MEEIVEEKGTDLTLCSPVLANLSKAQHSKKRSMKERSREVLGDTVLPSRRGTVRLDLKPTMEVSGWPFAFEIDSWAVLLNLT